MKNKYLISLLSTVLGIIPFIWYDCMCHVFKPDNILEYFMLFTNLLFTFPIVLVLVMILDYLKTKYQIKKQNKINEFGGEDF